MKAYKDNDSIQEEEIWAQQMSGNQPGPTAKTPSFAHQKETEEGKPNLYQ